MEKYGKHPVVYNARGTHATFFDKGVQWKYTDWTSEKVRWDLWHDLDVIFPWDWIKEDRQIVSDNNLNGVNYLTQVFRWGNVGIGIKVLGIE